MKSIQIFDITDCTLKNIIQYIVGAIITIGILKNIFKKYKKPIKCIDVSIKGSSENVPRKPSEVDSKSEIQKTNTSEERQVTTGSYSHETQKYSDTSFGDVTVNTSRYSEESEDRCTENSISFTCESSFKIFPNLSYKEVQTDLYLLQNIEANTVQACGDPAIQSTITGSSIKQEVIDNNVNGVKNELWNSSNTLNNINELKIDRSSIELTIPSEKARVAAENETVIGNEVFTKENLIKEKGEIHIIDHVPTSEQKMVVNDEDVIIECDNNEEMDNSHLSLLYGEDVFMSCTELISNYDSLSCTMGNNLNHQNKNISSGRESECCLSRCCKKFCSKKGKGSDLSIEREPSNLRMHRDSVVLIRKSIDKKLDKEEEEALRATAEEARRTYCPPGTTCEPQPSPDQGNYVPLKEGYFLDPRMNPKESKDQIQKLYQNRSDSIPEINERERLSFSPERFSAMTKMPPKISNGESLSGKEEDRNSSSSARSKMFSDVPELDTRGPKEIQLSYAFNEVTEGRPNKVYGTEGKSYGIESSGNIKGDVVLPRPVISKIGETNLLSTSPKSGPCLKLFVVTESLNKLDMSSAEPGGVDNIAPTSKIDLISGTFCGTYSAAVCNSEQDNSMRKQHVLSNSSKKSTNISNLPFEDVEIIKTVEYDKKQFLEEKDNIKLSQDNFSRKKSDVHITINLMAPSKSKSDENIFGTTDSLNKSNTMPTNYGSIKKMTPISEVDPTFSGCSLFVSKSKQDNFVCAPGSLSNSSIVSTDIPDFQECQPGILEEIEYNEDQSQKEKDRIKFSQNEFLNRRKNLLTNSKKQTNSRHTKKLFGITDSLHKLNKSSKAPGGIVIKTPRWATSSRFCSKKVSANEQNNSASKWRILSERADATTDTSGLLFQQNMNVAVLNITEYDEGQSTRENVNNRFSQTEFLNGRRSGTINRTKNSKMSPKSRPTKKLFGIIDSLHKLNESSKKPGGIEIPASTNRFSTKVCQSEQNNSAIRHAVFSNRSNAPTDLSNLSFEQRDDEIIDKVEYNKDQFPKGKDNIKLSQSNFFNRRNDDCANPTEKAIKSPKPRPAKKLFGINDSLHKLNKSSMKPSGIEIPETNQNWDASPNGFSTKVCQSEQHHSAIKQAVFSNRSNVPTEISNLSFKESDDEIIDIVEYNKDQFPKGKDNVKLSQSNFLNRRSDDSANLTEKAIKSPKPRPAKKLFGINDSLHKLNKGSKKPGGIEISEANQKWAASPNGLSTKDCLSEQHNSAIKQAVFSNRSDPPTDFSNLSFEHNDGDIIDIVEYNKDQFQKGKDNIKLPQNNYFIRRSDASANPTENGITSPKSRPNKKLLGITGSLHKLNKNSKASCGIEINTSMSKMDPRWNGFSRGPSTKVLKRKRDNSVSKQVFSNSSNSSIDTSDLSFQECHVGVIKKIECDKNHFSKGRKNMRFPQDDYFDRKSNESINITKYSFIKKRYKLKDSKSLKSLQKILNKCKDSEKDIFNKSERGPSLFVDSSKKGVYSSSKLGEAEISYPNLLPPFGECYHSISPSASRNILRMRAMDRENSFNGIGEGPSYYSLG